MGLPAPAQQRPVVRLVAAHRPDGTPLPHDQCPMALALKEERPIRGAEAVAERPDGTRVPFMAFPTPLYDAAGALVGAVNMLIDLSEHTSAERVERRLISIVELSDDAIISKDLNGVIATWNKGAERLFGYFGGRDRRQADHDHHSRRPK